MHRINPQRLQRLDFAGRARRAQFDDVRGANARQTSIAANNGPSSRKALPARSARAVVDVESRAGDSRPDWILARDAAVLSLLYGAGLRISEALSIKRQDALLGGVDTLTVIGKGRKTRSVPVIAPAQQAVATYLELCPYALPADGPLFIGAKGGLYRRG